ncbi:MFS transporter [Ignatzschineria cameli]|uniref:MFS transporter n=2 Tax=Bacteria TaxID=2 RepID=A0A2U2AL36_9GAMM|nr:MFS transporter [Ignatzschineria cameli]PWD83831.1 MFS transporter [Ignatzschineria cameli]PWD88329.1 MFS transporter [Ignatzschineria cameli]PWD88496.1 MFS transporter [Ignatzschineria cameli]PWD89318.1 MFS transporter [Ignatzschineria cameli]
MTQNDPIKSVSGGEPRSVVPLMIALLMACMAFQLNATMLNPVLVTIAGALDTSEATIGLSQTAFFMSAALFSIFIPRLSDIVGRRKILFFLIFVTTIGGVLSAITPNIELYFVSRIIQGFSGPVVPLCLLMLHAEVNDPKRYGMLMGIITAVNGGIAGIDAFLGGFIATHFGFRPVFWFIAAVGLITLPFILKGVRETKPSAGQKMDWFGVLFLVITLAGFLVAFNEAGKVAAANWGLVAISIVIAILSFLFFIQIEKRINEPLVTVEHLKERSTWALLLTTVLTMTGIFAVVNGLVVSFAQNSEIGFNFTANKTAIYLLAPYALIGWLVGPFMGKLAPIWGYNRILRFGLIGSIIGILILMLFGLSSLTILIIGTLLIGVMYAGTANIMLNGLGVVLSPQDNPGFLPGMNAAAFHIGAGLSFALLPAMLVLSSDLLKGYGNGMLLGLVITVVALLVSFLIPKPVSAEVAGAE